MTKKLIITADDFGASETSNKRIMKCCAEGAVTDLSIIAAGDAFEHAVNLAKENNIKKIGAHLALTGNFSPLTPIRFSKGHVAFFAKYFMKLIKSEEIYAEFKAQITRIKKEGFKVTHLDSHQHVHMAPGILKTMVRLAKEENISYVRFTRGNGGIRGMLNDPYGFLRDILMLPMNFFCRRIMDKNNIKHNDYFTGYTRALRLRKKDFFNAAKNLKEGLTELGTHPGERPDEVNALCDKSFIDEIKTNGIELTSY